MVFQGENADSTPIKVWSATNGRMSWLVAIIVHNGHYHVSVDQATPHDTLDSAFHFADEFMGIVRSAEDGMPWTDVTDQAPDSVTNFKSRHGEG